MRTVVRNSFARQSIRAERVPVTATCHDTRADVRTCEWCGQQRITAGHSWLYRFHVDDDGGPRRSGPLADGKLFCSRGCCEAYTGQNFNETEG